jgi:hypothetical protein
VSSGQTSRETFLHEGEHLNHLVQLDRGAAYGLGRGECRRGDRSAFALKRKLGNNEGVGPVGFHLADSRAGELLCHHGVEETEGNLPVEALHGEWPVGWLGSRPRRPRSGSSCGGSNSLSQRSYF